MTLRLIDLEGNHYAAEASTNIGEQLNSDATLSINFQSTTTNDAFISDVSELWRISHVKGITDDTEYVIKLLSRKGVGNKMYASVNYTFYIPKDGEATFRLTNLTNEPVTTTDIKFLIKS